MLSPSTTGGLFIFVELVVRIGGEGVFDLIVLVLVGDGMGFVRGGDAGEGAVAAVVEEVFDGDEACGEEEEAKDRDCIVSGFTRY